MASNDGSPSFIRSNRGVAAILIVICAGLFLYLWTRDWIADEQRDGFTLGFFPLMAVILMLLCVIPLLFDRLSAEATPEMAKIKLGEVGRALLGLALMGVYYMLAWNTNFSQEWLRSIIDVIPFTGEFIVWTPIFFALGMYLLGVRPLLSAVITGVVVGLVIFGLFTLIGINLPSNFLVG